MMELDIIELPGIGVHDYFYDTAAKNTVIWHVSNWIIQGVVQHAATPDPPDAGADPGTGVF